MLKELLHILTPGNPLSDMADRFARMIGYAHEITLTAGRILDGHQLTEEERADIYSRDVKINKLERKIRKRVVTHLSLAGNRPSLPYCLLLVSLVKDVERLGDYAKNLAELGDLYDRDLPDDEIMRELQEIRAGVERAFQSAGEIFKASDGERALQLIAQGKGYARRCDNLLEAIAGSEYSAGLATVMALATRYYKRIGGHLLNILSSVVMPLHKVDYYDEDLVPEGVQIDEEEGEEPE